tara:strand:- start:1748 stop:2233 length:486 start_codon:yes stop_codon:yes gene_type:complete
MSNNNIATQAITEPSICIPRTLNNITWRTVKDTFEQILGKGTIDRVDLINDRNGDPFCKVFVHMRYWPTHGEAVNIRERLVSGEMVKIVYDNPWFWKCSASRLPKPDREHSSKKTPFVEYQTPTKSEAVADPHAASPTPISGEPSLRMMEFDKNEETSTEA